MIKNAIGFYMQKKKTSSGILIPGWRIPNVSDYQILELYVGGWQVAAGKLKEAGFLHWDTPNTGADNSFGFNGLGSGMRIAMAYNNGFLYLKSKFVMYYYYAAANYAASLYFSYDSATIGGISSQGVGASIRLIKDYTNLAHGQTGLVTDADGNVYNTICIGTQEWMAQSLKVTRFNDGISIPVITDWTEWRDIATPAMCYYNNDNANKDIYGALYNKYVVLNGI